MCQFLLLFSGLLFLLFCLFRFKNIVTINLVCGEDFWLNGIVTISLRPHCVCFDLETDGKRFVAAAATTVFSLFEIHDFVKTIQMLVSNHFDHTADNW